MKSLSHSFVNLARHLPESLRLGSLGFKTSEESRDRRLMTSCSFEGMYPSFRALTI